MTTRDLQQQFAGSLLGSFWLILQPLFLLLLYTFVFGLVLRVRFQPDGDTLSFALYLMSGLLPYHNFQDAVQRSTTILTENRDLLQRSQLPGHLLPMVAAMSSVVIETIGLLLLILLTAVLERQISVFLWLLPLLILFRLLITLGLAWLVAVLAVFLRDLRQLLNMLLLALFFATPILYPPQMIPEHWRWVCDWNPFYYLVTAYRTVILEGSYPPIVWLLGLLVFSLALFVVGLLSFFSLQERAKDLL